ncbi:hypothetical protein EPK99_06630 [Neorhizobium lilium]|uniref:Uncharacterized protein n=1 Tax=Neorhizobium lilium TaxID=2503024 RepID=A0A3S3VJW1_9HYPH|nr:hypothetical protein [Neorhizobium lilium]RWX78299.1 hypothetical protein EPK99_06630 [Neorhizobium lilium]
MTATRQKKLEYIRSFGPYALDQAVTAMLARKESNWLTDDQIDDITSQMVSDARWTQHHNMRERELAQSRRALAYTDAGRVYSALASEGAR